MKFTQRIENISKFSFLNNAMAIATKMENQFTFEFKNQSTILSDHCEMICSLKNKYLFVKSIDGKGFLIDAKLKTTSFNDFVSYNAVNDYVFLCKGNIWNRIYFLYSIRENKVLFESNEDIGYNIFHDKIYQINPNFISARKVINGEKLWTWKLENLLKDKRFAKGLKFEKIRAIEIDMIIGEYKDILWVFMNNGFIIGIDISEGKLIHCIGGANKCDIEIERLESKGHVYINYMYKLDSENGKIILLSDVNYFEIDLNADTLQKKWVDLSLNNKMIKCDMEGSNGFQFDESNFYFYDTVSGVVAIMDRISFQILWSYKISIEIKKGEFVIGLLDSLQINNDKLYVLDRISTLHIFEKENIPHSS